MLFRSIVKVSSKGQVTLPASLRRRLNITPGTYLRLVESERDFRVVVAPRGIASLLGAVHVDGPQDFRAARDAAMEERANDKHPRN